MGKYMKKSKTAGDVAVFMDVTSSSSLGVRTRSHTLKPPPSSPQFPDPSSYLQLRSRRLLKLPPQPVAANSRLKDSSAKTASSLRTGGKSTRESTPCSLIRDSNAIHTPGSSTRQRTHQIIHEHMQRNIPTAYEMEEFFAYAENQQQTIFMDKYNFDIVNDVPLSGRYEWVPVLH